MAYTYQYIPTTNEPRKVKVNSAESTAEMIVSMFRGEVDDETLEEWVEEYFGVDSDESEEVSSLLDMMKEKIG